MRLPVSLRSHSAVLTIVLLVRAHVTAARSVCMCGPDPHIYSRRDWVHSPPRVTRRRLARVRRNAMALMTFRRMSRACFLLRVA